MAEQEDMELTSPHKHIKNTSTCGTILTENKLETVRRTPIQPKLQERFQVIEQDGKRHRLENLGPERDLKGRKGPYRQTLILESKWVKPHMGCPSPGVYWKRQVPLAVRRTSWTERKAGEAYSTREECACAGLPTVRVERVCTGSCCLPALPNPNGVNNLALLTPHHSLAHDLDQLGPGKRLSLPMQRQTGGPGL